MLNKLLLKIGFGKLAGLLAPKRHGATTTVSLSRGGNGVVVVRWSRGFVNINLSRKKDEAPGAEQWLYQIIESDTVVASGHARSRIEATAQAVAEAMEWLN